LEPEFDMFGVSFKDRGPILDESLRALKELWTSDNPSFSGEWVTFGDLIFEPRPWQKPHPPIWIGGWGKNVLRRAVELGDGIYPATAGPLSRLIRDRQEVLEMLERAGRDPSGFRFAHAIDYGGMAGPAHLNASPIRRDQMIFGLDAEPIIEHVGKASQAGWDYMSVRFPGPDHHEVMDAMNRFHAEVMVPVGGPMSTRP
jgi:hypothetical protein